MTSPQADAARSQVTSLQLRSAIAASGGFTVRRRNGQFRAHGVCVATRPHAEMTFPSEQWDDDRVDAWLSSLCGERRWRASHIGGWLEPVTGMVVLDVVRVIPCRLKHFAFVVGRLKQQDYAFDLSERRVMALG
jgi:hypothetical protein